ncbi:lipoprotein, putative [Xanthomonas oryzae pv. oryzae PXO99A]|uniref:Lipoprotein, putative n=1 Tax=Xanthomonas oryzae pv. oryzae (strain PXO99A) TaxID=360094 RepID=A0A0K0GG04_XANOP|nr:lipoprotein, putative [Xanthomonas oryzae pv. oryzae PXO99A]
MRRVASSRLIGLATAAHQGGSACFLRCLLTCLRVMQLQQSPASAAW